MYVHVRVGCQMEMGVAILVAVGVVPVQELILLVVLLIVTLREAMQKMRLSQSTDPLKHGMSVA